MGNSLEEMLADLIKGQADYGDAMTVVAKVTEKNTDAQGNLQKIRVLVDVKLDLNKLPADKPVNDEMLKAIHAEAELGLEGVVTVSAYEG